MALALLRKWCYTVAMERNEHIVSTNTRYPKDLHSTLQRLAREHRRSFNAEVMWALQRYVQQEEAGQEITPEIVAPDHLLS
jgi:Arc-like DNA binding dprotein